MIKEFLKSSANVLFADIGTKVIGFGVISVLTFLLDPVNLGKYNALLTTVTSLFSMSGLGIGLVLQRESAKHSMQVNKDIGHMISAGFLCMATSMLLLVLFFECYHQNLDAIIFGNIDPKLVEWIPLLAILYFLVQSPLTILLGLGLFKLYSFRNMIEASITGGCVVLGAYLWHLQGVIYGLLISLSLNAVIVWVIFRRAVQEKQMHFGIKKFKIFTRKILGLGIPYFIGNTFIGALANIILIGLFSKHIGYAELGYLRLGLSLSAILMVVPNAAKTVSVTFIAKQGLNTIRLQSLQIRYLFFLIIAGSLIAALVLKPIVSLIFGNAYDEGVKVYTMILLINVFFSIHQVLNSFVAGRGGLIFSGIVNSIIVIAYIISALFMIPRMGIEGYYISFGGSYFLGMLVFIIYEFKNNTYTDKMSIVTFLMGSFLLMTGAIMYYSIFSINWIGNLVSGFLILTYVFVCLKYLLRPEEKILIADYIKAGSIFRK